MDQGRALVVVIALPRSLPLAPHLRCQPEERPGGCGCLHAASHSTIIGMVCACLPGATMTVYHDYTTASLSPAFCGPQVLCHFLNAIQPGTVKKVETSNLAFKQMENISSFIKACRAMGVPEFEVGHDFHTTIM